MEKLNTHGVSDAAFNLAFSLSGLMRHNNRAVYANPDLRHHYFSLWAATVKKIATPRQLLAVLRELFRTHGNAIQVITTLPELLVVAAALFDKACVLNVFSNPMKYPEIESQIVDLLLNIFRSYNKKPDGTIEIVRDARVEAYLSTLADRSKKQSFYGSVNCLLVAYEDAVVKDKEASTTALAIPIEHVFEQRAKVRISDLTSRGACEAKLREINSDERYTDADYFKVAFHLHKKYGDNTVVRMAVLLKSAGIIDLPASIPSLCDVSVMFSKDISDFHSLAEKTDHQAGIEDALRQSGVSVVSSRFYRPVGAGFLFTPFTHREKRIFSDIATPEQQLQRLIELLQESEVEPSIIADIALIQYSTPAKYMLDSEIISIDDGGDYHGNCNREVLAIIMHALVQNIDILERLSRCTSIDELSNISDILYWKKPYYTLEFTDRIHVSVDYRVVHAYRGMSLYLLVSRIIHEQKLPELLSFIRGYAKVINNIYPVWSHDVIERIVRVVTQFMENHTKLQLGAIPKEREPAMEYIEYLFNRVYAGVEFTREEAECILQSIDLDLLTGVLTENEFGRLHLALGDVRLLRLFDVLCALEKKMPGMLAEKMPLTSLEWKNLSQLLLEAWVRIYMDGRLFANNYQPDFSDMPLFPLLYKNQLSLLLGDELDMAIAAIKALYTYRTVRDDGVMFSSAVVTDTVERAIEAYACALAILAL